MASLMFRRAATALAPARLGWALSARGRSVLGGCLPSPAPAPAPVPATTRRALGSLPLADGGPQSATPTPSDTAPPPRPGVEFPEVQQVAGGTTSPNYILYAMNQMRIEILAEQRKIIEGNSVVLQEVRDLRKDLITGRDFLGESRKVMESSLKVHEQVKETRADMKSELVVESRKILEGNSKVSDEIRELRNDIKLTVADFKIYVEKLIIRVLLGIAALLVTAISAAWPYIVEFVMFLRNKWEIVSKSKGD